MIDKIADEYIVRLLYYTVYVIFLNWDTVYVFGRRNKRGNEEMRKHEIQKNL